VATISDVRPPRPVVIASLLLGGTALVSALDVVATRMAAGHLGDAAPGFLRTMAEAAVDEAPEWVDHVRGSLNYSTAVAAGALVVFAVLAVLLRRRSQAARVAVWVAALLAVCFFGVGLADSPENFSPPDGSREIVEQAWPALLPGWYPTVRSLLFTGEVLTVLVASFLLLRTPAADFYRPQVVEPGLGAYLVRKQAQQEQQGD
jgi:hypothetical protein